MKKFSFNNKNVIFIIKVCALAGAERQALGLAKHLKEKYNCNISFIATHSNVQTKEFEDFAIKSGVQGVHYYGVPSLSIKKGWSYSNLKKTIRAYIYMYKITKGVKKMKPDVIIPYMNFASKLSSLIYEKVGAKHTFWHELGESDNYYYDFLESRAISKSPFFCANAEDGFDTFVNKYNVNKSNCHLLTQYVSFQKVDYNVTEIREELKIPQNKLVYGMVAHYRDQKHQSLLIEAFSEICRNRDIHLIFLGNKDNDVKTLEKYNSLKALVRKLKIDEHVTFLSNVRVEKVLSIIDIGVLVSQFEGAPTVLMEYMLYGKPIIATNHIGCKLLMGESDFLIPKNDLLSLIEKMEILYANELLRVKIGLKHSEDVKKYSLESYCNRLEFLFEKYS